MASNPNLSSLIKSYDVRGVFGDDLTVEVVRAIGAAFADAVVLADGETTVAIGRDMRDSGPALEAALVDGLADRGVDAILIGMCATDGLYHASGSLGIPGAMITASHNPAKYNGIKFCRSRARAVGEETGLAEVRTLASSYLAGGIPLAEARGTVTRREMLKEYGAFLRSLVPLDGGRTLKVVVDAANGMAGLTVPAVLGTAAGLPELPLTIIPLYFELDGSFPNHEANPLQSENLRDLQAAVVEHGADIGLAFDGDADRCFFVDERGELVKPSTVTALVGVSEARRELAAGRTPTIIYNLISSMAVRENLLAVGARPVRSRVGHSYIKADMAQENAVFGGEHSGHYYFRDFYFADSGMLAAMHVLGALGRQEDTLSALLAPYDPYVSSGEINSTVSDLEAAASRVRGAFVTAGVEADDLDGLTVSHWAAPGEGDGIRWWFNVRPSNTEPLLRLNVEASDRATMEGIRDRVLLVIRAED